MKIALVQGNIFWENPERNAAYYEKMIKRTSPATEIVVFPEAFTTGFTMNASRLPQLTAFPVDEWLAEKANTYRKVIVAGAFVRDNGRYYNRLFWVQPDGTVYHYDKRHLFSHGGENRIFTPGNRRVTISYGDLRFNLQICYDLRFPVWCANTYDRASDTYGYDVQIFVANWPAKRRHAYLPLIRGRAVENQAFVLWVNRVGRDGNYMIHSGDTRVVHPSGEVVALVKSHTEGILEYDLDPKEITEFRRNFPLGPDWDEYLIPGTEDFIAPG